MENEKETITTSTSEPKTVVFPDYNLEIAIINALGKQSGEEILVDELVNLTVLLADNSKIADLIELELSNNQISDIYPLANLTNLMLLNLNMNNIVGNSAISNLTKLNWLNI